MVFSLFFSDALEVYVNNIPVTGWTVTASFTGGVSTDAAVTLASPAASGAVVRIDGAQVAKREADYVNGDPNLTAKLNIELSQIWASIQELEVATGRSVKIFSTSMPFAPETDAAIVWDGAKFIPGPTTDEVANAQGYAETAAAAAAQITPIADDITTVAGISADVTTVAGIASDVTTVVGQAAQIETVAGQSANITALGPISDEMAALARITDEIVIVAAQPTQALPVLLSTTALQGLNTAHAGDRCVLGSNGGWNLAKGATNYQDTVFWTASGTSNGVSWSRIGTGFDPLLGDYVDYQISGTCVGTSSFSGVYNSTNTRAPAVPGQQFTMSFWYQILAEHSTALPVAFGVRAEIIEETAPSSLLTVSSNFPSTKNTTPTLVSHTRAVQNLSANQIRGSISLITAVGETVNYRVRLWGVQFEIGPVRTNGQYQEILLPDLILPGQRRGFAFGKYTGQHTVTAGIPQDTTPPLWTEGAHLISVDYVPRKIGSLLVVRATLPIVGMNASKTAIAAIFVNETCFRTAYFTPASSDASGCMVLEHVMTVTSLTNVKVSLRFGPEAGAGNTATINMDWLGAVSTNVATHLTIEEIAQ